MSILLCVVGGLLVYVVGGFVALPRLYATARENIKNTMSYQAPFHTARIWSYWMAVIWPVGILLLTGLQTTRRVDRQVELMRAERAELDKLRAEALRGLDF